MFLEKFSYNFINVDFSASSDHIPRRLKHITLKKKKIKNVMEESTQGSTP